MRASRKKKRKMTTSNTNNEIVQKPADPASNRTSWKDLFNGLQQTAKENQAVLNEVKEELEKQKEKVRQEIQNSIQELKLQKTDLEDLLDSMKDDALLLAGDHSALEECTRMIQEQLDKTSQLLSAAQALLEVKSDLPVLSDPSRSKTRAEKEKSEIYMPKLFRKEHILGNWVHYFDNNTFTCQSFWEDGSFKEYDFENDKLAGERDGIYTINNGHIDLLYGSGNKDQYQITGFSDERIDYIIHGTNVQFDYMPETLLNQFLDAQ